MAVITISRQFGAGGVTLGERIADRLGYHYAHENMIKEVAERARVSTEGVAAFEKSGGTKLMRFIEKFVKADYLERIMAGRYGYLNSETYVELIKDIVNRLYEEDEAVIIGRGGQYILRDRPHCIHVLLVADEVTRHNFMIQHYDLEPEVAARAVAAAASERASFLDCFEKEDHDNPNLYHLCLNISLMGLDAAEEMVLNLLKIQEGFEIPPKDWEKHI